MSYIPFIKEILGRQALNGWMSASHKFTQEIQATWIENGRGHEEITKIICNDPDLDQYRTYIGASGRHLSAIEQAILHIYAPSVYRVASEVDILPTFLQEKMLGLAQRNCKTDDKTNTGCLQHLCGKSLLDYDGSWDAVVDELLTNMCESLTGLKDLVRVCAKIVHSDFLDELKTAVVQITSQNVQPDLIKFPKFTNKLKLLGRAENQKKQKERKVEEMKNAQSVQDMVNVLLHAPEKTVDITTFCLHLKRVTTPGVGQVENFKPSISFLVKEVLYICNKCVQQGGDFGLPCIYDELREYLDTASGLDASQRVHHRIPPKTSKELKSFLKKCQDNERTEICTETQLPVDLVRQDMQAKNFKFAGCARKVSSPRLLKTTQDAIVRMYDKVKTWASNATTTAATVVCTILFCLKEIDCNIPNSLEVAKSSILKNFDAFNIVDSDSLSGSIDALFVVCVKVCDRDSKKYEDMVNHHSWSKLSQGVNLELQKYQSLADNSNGTQTTVLATETATTTSAATELLGSLTGKRVPAGRRESTTSSTTTATVNSNSNDASSGSNVPPAEAESVKSSPPAKRLAIKPSPQAKIINQLAVGFVNDAEDVPMMDSLDQDVPRGSNDAVNNGNNVTENEKDVKVTVSVQESTLKTEKKEEDAKAVTKVESVTADVPVVKDVIQSNTEVKVEVKTEIKEEEAIKEEKKVEEAIIEEKKVTKEEELAPVANEGMPVAAPSPPPQALFTPSESPSAGLMSLNVHNDSQ